MTTSIINDLETALDAGSKTINKIAYGLELQGRSEVRTTACGINFSKRDFLIPDFAKYPPEILNFLPYAQHALVLGQIQSKRSNYPRKVRIV